MGEEKGGYTEDRDRPCMFCEAFKHLPKKGPVRNSIIGWARENDIYHDGDPPRVLYLGKVTHSVHAFADHEASRPMMMV